jgi:hypothetical protein
MKFLYLKRRLIVPRPFRAHVHVMRVALAHSQGPDPARQHAGSAQQPVPLLTAQLRCMVSLMAASVSDAWGLYLVRSCIAGADRRERPDGQTPASLV